MTRPFHSSQSSNKIDALGFRAAERGSRQRRLTSACGPWLPNLTTAATSANRSAAGGWVGRRKSAEIQFRMTQEGLEAFRKPIQIKPPSKNGIASRLKHQRAAVHVIAAALANKQVAGHRKQGPYDR